ncbi:MAG: DNA replication/repair protein RecF [Gammaproteobacteria bacterium]|nr:DNA replication/repair protein RecF [Gammaproteobacteria bacterium]
MSLSHLEISRFRNLTELQIQPSPRINIFTGDNAAGKTSVLEAIYFLSVSRSFRSHQAKDVIQQGEENLQIVGRLTDKAEKNKTTILGLERGHQHTRLRINAESVNQTSEMAAFLPVQLIHPEGHHLLEQGPKQRRKFLDWGVFHVEHTFLSFWNQFSRILKQRNAAIRTKSEKSAIQLWDKGLIEYGLKITGLRNEYLNNLKPYVDKYCSLLISEQVELKFRPGWNQDLNLEEVIHAQIDNDIKLGYTRSGPQRAEIEFINNKRPVQNYFSRGQQKMLVCALRLAQIEYLKDQAGKETVLLLDDLAAELDSTHRQSLLDAAMISGAQLFITMTEANLLKLPESLENKMFHVEHGFVSEVL